MTNVFVGNLDITVTEQQLRELFAAHGAVETITIVKDRDTGTPRHSLRGDDARDGSPGRYFCTRRNDA